MIFRHYRRWIPGLQVGAGRRIGALLQESIEGRERSEPSPKPSPTLLRTSKTQINEALRAAEGVEFELSGDFLNGQ